MLKLIAIYLIIINIAGFAAMGIDKGRAKREAWRIPESVLIGFAVVGGSVGAILGMSTFHHKTKHPKFYIGLPLILVLQLAALYMIARQ